MKVTILGGSGFIGSALALRMAEVGYIVEVLTRSNAGLSRVHPPNIAYSFWDGQIAEALLPFIEGRDVVVNLAGSGIADSRWSESRKQQLLSSRLLPTAALCSAVSKAVNPPAVVVQGSAVGFYGYEYLDNDPVDEFGEKGRGFLADICLQWEDAILPLEDVVKRLIVVRTGVVLGKGGFLKKLMLPFKMGAGGRVGTGLQPFPWIHIEDEVSAIMHLIQHPQAEGVYNLTAPEYACNLDFTAAFAKALHRFAIFPVPAFLLNIVYGEQLTREVLLGGAEVVPRRLLDSGYRFRFTNLDAALKDILR